ncbi:uncharacterized protein LOC130669258 [Microplitis mediator]|uniref:uncharacterized protein LOC130669258 n=1 Tax=Microplitis mediator TaxID=375433 RepID=UPI002552AD72|nr:uncharacterized protein LOC130669258 [Microplitis mediator]
MFIIIIKLNVSSVTSKLVPIKKGDPTEWRENGAEANFAQFNNLYAVSVNEKVVTPFDCCSGRCDTEVTTLSYFVDAFPELVPHSDQCAGLIRSCWFEKESEERKKAAADYENSFKIHYGSMMRTTWASPSNVSFYYRIILRNTGNICKCLSERDDISNANNTRGKLLDSICFDPVSVDNGYVATGARFKRHGNVMYLELQQGILSLGKIDPSTLKWTTSNNCNVKTKLFRNFRNDSTYDSLRIRLEDLTLSENAVVTGVTLGDSLRGRYVDNDGNFNENEPEVTQKSQCHGR